MYQRIEAVELAKLARESQLVECKKTLAERREGCESLTSMVNADTGRGLVLFGVAPDGKVVGVEPGNLDKAQQSLAQHLGSTLDPRIPVNIEILECDAKSMVAIRAERPRNVAIVEYDGRAFIREGSTTRRLSSSERSGLNKRRDRANHPGPWRCDRCGSVAGMISGMVITDTGVERSYQCRCGGEWWPAT